MGKDYTKCGHPRYTHVAYVKGKQGTEGQNCLVIGADGWRGHAGFTAISGKNCRTCGQFIESDCECGHSRVNIGDPDRDTCPQWVKQEYEN
jgi:hypothetical protein